MQSAKIFFLITNLCGGILVLGSYAAGLQSHPDAVEMLWGGVPLALRPYYTLNMLPAAAGYFVFSLYLLLAVDAAQVRVFARSGFNLFNMLYAGILLPSALWMPLSLLTLQRDSVLLLWSVRLALWLVALSSLALFAALFAHRPRRKRRFQWAAAAGAFFFCVQTVLLDAVLWVYYFP